MEKRARLQVTAPLASHVASLELPQVYGTTKKVKEVACVVRRVIKVVYIFSMYRGDVFLYRFVVVNWGTKQFNEPVFRGLLVAGYDGKEGDRKFTCSGLCVASCGRVGDTIVSSRGLKSFPSFPVMLREDYGKVFLLLILSRRPRYHEENEKESAK